MNRDVYQITLYKLLQSKFKGSPLMSDEEIDGSLELRRYNDPVFVSEASTDFQFNSHLIRRVFSNSVRNPLHIGAVELTLPVCIPVNKKQVVNCIWPD